jgi:putative tryptophan/tyrosine transport system substrate-binding protein
MKRREFIAGLGGVVAWPLAALAQQPDHLVRIGFLAGAGAAQDYFEPRLSAFRHTLAERGWAEGRNLRIDYRFAGGDRDLLRKYATELVGLQPNVVLAVGSGSVASLKQSSRTVPIVFTEVIDPVGGGLVESLARPGGNATGFLPYEYGFAGKWLELLKQIAPRITRAAVLRDPDQFAGVAQFAVIQAVAPSLRMELTPIDVRDATRTERSVAAFARGGNGGLVVLTSFAAVTHLEAIVSLAARLRLPAVYSARDFIAGGGLLSYAPDLIDQFRLAADYADRILKGEKPADLPVQQVTKMQLSINLKTAKALGLEIPPSILAIADEVIE